MSEILKQDIVTIDGKEYVLRTVDLTAFGWHLSL